MFREHGQIVLTDFVVGDEDQELKPGDVWVLWCTSIQIVRLR